MGGAAPAKTKGSASSSGSSSGSSLRGVSGSGGAFLARLVGDASAAQGMIAAVRSATAATSKNSFHPRQPSPSAFASRTSASKSGLTASSTNCEVNHPETWSHRASRAADKMTFCAALFRRSQSCIVAAAFFSPLRALFSSVDGFRRLTSKTCRKRARASARTS
ncbi:hypothetical protein M885DRAFT_505888 [Pelagophyceae sp. CCMP2097]|nr:hypothetical protein M885DRAFT_505888 [Pelagophyceae sp. CCMP2097]